MYVTTSLDKSPLVDLWPGTDKVPESWLPEHFWWLGIYWRILRFCFRLAALALRASS